MRLLSATGFVVAAMMVGGCLSRGGLEQAPRDAEIVSKLKNLGVEGLTYQNDLGAVDSIRVKNVHNVDDDYLLEDIHGHLTYVDGATMNPVWSFYGMPSAFDEKPDFTPSSIIGIAGGRLYSITRFNGTEAPASREIAIVPSAGPVSTDSTLYVPTYGSKSLQTVSLGNGYIGWGARTNGEIVTDLAKGGPLGGDTLYAATTNGFVMAFPTESSNRPAPGAAWGKNLHAPIYFELAVDGGHLGAVNSHGTLYVMDRGSGDVLWEATPKSSSERAESGAMFSNSMVFGRWGNELRAFDRATGEEKWTLEGGRTFLAERDDFLLIGGENGWVYQVDSASGEVKAEEHLPGVIFPVRTAPNRNIHAITNRGLLISVEYGF